MQPNHLNLLLAFLGFVAAVLLDVEPPLVFGLSFGWILGVLSAPYVGRGSAWLARYLGQVMRDR
jgi:hypothetical protein